MKPTKRIVILNRAPATSQGGWIHIVPKGELPNKDAGIVQVLDDQSMDAILARIEKDKNRLGDKWPGIYAGREHFIYDDNQDSAALGWFKDFEKRADGIWAKEDGLTPAGETAVKNRDYKYTSFVADRSDLKKVEGKSGGLPRYRVVGIETVGFTNYSNAGSSVRSGSGLLNPITNRARQRDVASNESNEPMKKLPKNKMCPDCDVKLKQGADGDSDYECPECHEHFAASSETDDATKTKNRKPKMKTIANKLGLADEASEDSILSAVTKLLNRVTELEPLGTENTALKNRLTSLDSDAVDTLLASHGVKDDKVKNRLKPVIAALPSLAERTAALVDFGFKPGSNGQDGRATTTRVLNRGTGNTATAEDSTAGADEQVIAEKIKNRAGELQGKGMKFDAAWNQAQREVLAKK